MQVVEGKNGGHGRQPVEEGQVAGRDNRRLEHELRGGRGSAGEASVVAGPSSAAAGATGSRSGGLVVAHSLAPLGQDGLIAYPNSTTHCPFSEKFPRRVRDRVS